jgi:hypothetical protein
MKKQQETYIQNDENLYFVFPGIFFKALFRGKLYLYRHIKHIIGRTLSFVTLYSEERRRVGEWEEGRGRKEGKRV